MNIADTSSHGQTTQPTPHPIPVDTAEFYKTLIDTSPDAIFLVDRQGSIRYASSRAYTMFCIPAGESLIGTSLVELVVLPTRSYVANRFNELIAGRIKPEPMEYRIQRKDGSSQWVEVHGSCMVDENGLIWGMMLLCRDTAERKLVEEALRESEERYRQLVELSPMGIAIYQDGLFVYVNQAGQSMMGAKDPWELVKKPILSIVHPDSRPVVIERMEQLAKGVAIAPMQEKLIRLDGSMFLAEVSALQTTFNNRPAGQVIVRDITNAKKVEEALQLQVTAVQAAANAIVITDREGKIVSVNRAFSHLTGYTEDEVIGKDLNVQNSGKQSARFFQSMWETITSGRVWKGEIENQRKDGSLYFEEMTITPVRNQAGEITHFISIKQDITEQKKLQQQLLQAQKVQSIGTLAGGIAHDFNNILGIILGYATMFKEHRIDPQQADEIMSVIIKNVERGTVLVQKILTFARASDGVVQSLNVPDLIGELVSMLEETFPKTIVFSVQCARPLPAISGDRTQIHQALLNLCVNARDAMPAGGSITIAVDVRTREELRPRFHDVAEADYLCITVSDTGVGMDEATRVRVFDPFFTTKEHGKGTGLGLSVVYGIMQSHHGFIDVESRPGIGTTFMFILPVPAQRQEAQDEQARPPAPEPRPGTETILIVEDEEFLMKMICIALKAKGYRLLTARDGQEAIDLFAQHQQSIDAVITDIGLPVMNGFDVFTRLKAMNPQVRVLLASGYFEPAMKDALQNAGAKGFIQKPYRPADVVRTLRQVLDSR